MSASDFACGLASPIPWGRPGTARALIAEPGEQAQVQALVDAARAAAQFAIDWRNRRLAHRDLDLALQRSPTPLEPATREKVDAALAALVDVMNQVELRFCKMTTFYGRPAATGTSEDLLRVIRDGLLRLRDREAAWERGELHPDDRNPPPDV